MKRPLPLRILPDRLKLSLWARFYQRHCERWPELHQGAALKFAPHVRMDVSPGDLVSGAIALTGIWELGLTRHLLALARRGGKMIEVGANLGYFSLLWAAANPKNECVIFEASPRNIDLLRRNIEQNGFGSRIHLFAKAAGKSRGSMPFYVGPQKQLGFGGLANSASNETVEVEVVRVDQVVADNGPIDLLKIDTEGADAWVLMGCEKLLRERRVRAVWYEQNKPRIRELGLAEDAAQRYLESVGYFSSPRGNPAGEVVDWLAMPA